jgi:AraC family transcriptional regulator of adaptative response/methylated-DNA-[protein]-cysteine methyltransferase
MVVTKSSPRSENRYSTDDRWRAVVDRNLGADGLFFYSVKTTGVFCRPSCASRRARRENVRFHRTVKEAEQAGFRACKRCHPTSFSLGERYGALISRACRLIEDAPEPPDLESLAKEIGMSPSHFHRIFKSLTGLTPKSYTSAHRSQRVREKLSQNSSVTAAVYSAGFNSNGRFYATSTKVLGMTPTSFRTGGMGTAIRFAVECHWIDSRGGFQHRHLLHPAGR